jgi:predicted amidohydrolase
VSARRIRAAAIQMEAKLSDVPGNIAQAADLAENALRAGAEVVALPEFFTTQVVLDERLFCCALLPENDALRMMQSLALAYGAIIGGSYLEFDDGDVYNSYVLVSPDGSVSKHRKDLPTMAENAYYIGGDDDGLVKCSDLDVGIAVCWETIRSVSANRLRGKCELIMSGSHWWSAPEWRFARSYFAHHARLNADQMLRAPGRFASMVGAPMLHGAHCGVLEGRYAFSPRWSVPMRTHLVGETQIVDASGTIIARKGADEGAGFIVADIVTGAQRPRIEVPDSFWLENLPPLIRAMWATQNAVGQSIYIQAKKAGRIRPFGSGAVREPSSTSLHPGTPARISNQQSSENAQ